MSISNGGDVWLWFVYGIGKLGCSGGCVSLQERLIFFSIKLPIIVRTIHLICTLGR